MKPHKTTRRSKKSDQLPLALQLIGRRCDYPESQQVDRDLSQAYRHARRYLADADEDFRLSVLETTITRADLQRRSESQIKRALDAATIDASEVIGNLKYHARWDGFLLGLAVAFEIHRSFNAGSSR